MQQVGARYGYHAVNPGSHLGYSASVTAERTGTSGRKLGSDQEFDYVERQDAWLRLPAPDHFNWAEFVPKLTSSLHV
ncbi:hypothetical protein [Granulicella arctica]|uniref:hypothetical protein n=1 Tax=Granulicella arctica TaxID=940613 RepID=UPI0021DFE7C6|nr:hypothetical protein [Granulicella arctica]